MYLKSVTPASYSVSVDYLIVDSAGNYSVPTMLIYPTDDASLKSSSVSEIYNGVGSAGSNAIAVVVSTEESRTEINGLNYGTRYTLVLGNVSAGDESTATFTAVDTITFTTSELSVTFKVTSINVNSIGIEAGLLSEFEVKSGSYFYLAAYDYDDTGSKSVFAVKKLSDSDVLALKASGGYTGTLTPENTSDNLSTRGDTVTVMLGYTSEKWDDLKLNADKMSSYTIKDVTIPNTLK
jgi:hypothetical protein